MSDGDFDRRTTGDSSGAMIFVGALLVIGLIVAAYFYYPRRGHFVDGKEFGEVREIGQAMRAYASRNGRYPEGASSTEVFQKLLDEGDLDDPGVFYLPYPGKTPASRGARLKPENVCWDTTGGMAPGDSDLLPLVFITGCRVHYVPDGSAVALAAGPLPAYYHQKTTWVEWWNHDSILAAEGRLVVLSKGGDGITGYKMQTDGSIPHFIASQFEAQGKTFYQLTPDGILK